MRGFELDFWDYATFVTAALADGSVMLIYIWIAGLPRRIAIARKHPDAEAVKLMGDARGSAAGAGGSESCLIRQLTVAPVRAQLIEHLRSGT